MKKFLFALLAGLIPALAIITETHAQIREDMASVPLVKNYGKIASIGVDNNSNILDLKNVNTKALKNFKKQYKVNNEKWTEGPDCFVASYTADEIMNYIYFSKKGQWTGYLKIYKEDKMPTDIRKMIKQEYYDYDISTVQEVQIAADPVPVYIVVVHDAKNTKMIKVQDGDMTVYQEFKKS